MYSDLHGLSDWTVQYSNTVFTVRDGRATASIRSNESAHNRSVIQYYSTALINLHKTVTATPLQRASGSNQALYIALAGVYAQPSGFDVF